MTQIRQWMLIVIFYYVFFVMTLIHVRGEIIQTKFARVSDTGLANIKCAKDAGERQFVATKIDASRACTSLAWDSLPSYDPDTIYFIKKHVEEVYEIPMVLDGNSMRLPVTFTEGAYIDMLIEFTREDFSYGFIQLSDRLPGDTGDETLMIVLELLPPGGNAYVKSYASGWANQGSITPYPFPAGSTHKITFKAHAYDLEILIDDVHTMMCRGFTAPRDARTLTFSNNGMLLHKIEFVGVNSN